MLFSPGDGRKGAARLAATGDGREFFPAVHFRVRIAAAAAFIGCGNHRRRPGRGPLQARPVAPDDRPNGEAPMLITTICPCCGWLCVYPASQARGTANCLYCGQPIEIPDRPLTDEELRGYLRRTSADADHGEPSPLLSV